MEASSPKAWKVPESLEEAYELRDSAGSEEKREFYQEHVYRLRAREYRARGIVTRRSALRREKLRGTRRAQARQEVRESSGRPFWKRLFLRE